MCCSSETPCSRCAVTSACWQLGNSGAIWTMLALSSISIRLMKPCVACPWLVPPSLLSTLIILRCALYVAAYTMLLSSIYSIVGNFMHSCICVSQMSCLTAFYLSPSLLLYDRLAELYARDLPNCRVAAGPSSIHEDVYKELYDLVDAARPASLNPQLGWTAIKPLLQQYLRDVGLQTCDRDCANSASNIGITAESSNRTKETVTVDSLGNSCCVHRLNNANQNGTCTAECSELSSEKLGSNAGYVSTLNSPAAAAADIRTDVISSYTSDVSVDQCTSSLSQLTTMDKRLTVSVCFFLRSTL